MVELFSLYQLTVDRVALSFRSKTSEARCWKRDNYKEIFHVHISRTHTNVSRILFLYSSVLEHTQVCSTVYCYPFHLRDFTSCQRHVTFNPNQHFIEQACAECFSLYPLLKLDTLAIVIPSCSFIYDCKQYNIDVLRII